MPTLPFEEIVLPFEAEEDFGPEHPPTVDPNPPYTHDAVYAVIEDQLTWRPEDG